MKDWTTIVVPEGGMQGAIRALLDLAESPTHVRTQGPNRELLVPPYLAEKYTTPPKRRRPKKEEGGDE